MGGSCFTRSVRYQKLEAALSVVLKAVTIPANRRVRGVDELKAAIVAELVPPDDDGKLTDEVRDAQRIKRA